MTRSYSFNEVEARDAYEIWGCNCGPAALATALDIKLHQVREAVEKVGFATKGYMSPSMMAAAIPLAGGKITSRNVGNCFPAAGLARIQWTGPWTAKGANPKWAYNYTHWIAAFNEPQGLFIFDVNSGFSPRQWWEENIIPAILEECVPRNDGGWLITHSWEVSKQS